MDKRFPLEDQIEMLSWALKGRVVSPKDADYDAVRTVALGQYDCRPAALVRPANAADVAAVINFARATDMELAIRSGGHSTIGASGNDGGLVIDLRDLNRLDIDPAAQTAWAGTGLTAGEVSHGVEQHGLIIGFGDSATVGIGGLTLGGGIGYMIRKHGLTIDNLLAAEVVTAEGDVVIADAEHHPDLFWALRGGGGNFGVVTRLKFQLHPLPEFIGGPLVLPLTPEVLAGFVAVSEAAPNELSTIAFVMPIPPVPFVAPELHGKLALIGMMAYSGAAADAGAALAPFRALATPIFDGVRPAPYSSLYMLDPPPDQRPSVAIRSRMIRSFGIQQAAEMIARLEACDAPMKMAQVRVFGGAFAHVAPAATAFAHRDAPMMIAFLAMYGGPHADPATYERWATDAVDSVSHGQEAGAYVNFLSKEGTLGLGAAYPPATLARLRQVKKTYDPENIFHLNQNITPAA